MYIIKPEGVEVLYIILWENFPLEYMKEGVKSRARLPDDHLEASSGRLIKDFQTASPGYHSWTGQR